MVERIKEFRTNLSQLDTWKKEVIKFILIGFSGAMFDATIYTLGLKVFNLWPSVAKALAYVSGTLLVYNISKRWTYKRTERSHREMVKFFMVYGTSFFANVGANRLGINWFTEFQIHPSIDPYLSNYKLAWFFAAVVSSLINFAGQKWFVFIDKKNGSQEEEEEVTDLA